MIDRVRNLNAVKSIQSRNVLSGHNSSLGISTRTSMRLPYFTLFSLVLIWTICKLKCVIFLAHCLYALIGFLLAHTYHVNVKCMTRNTCVENNLVVPVQAICFLIAILMLIVGFLSLKYCILMTKRWNFARRQWITCKSKIHRDTNDIIFFKMAAAAILDTSRSKCAGPIISILLCFDTNYTK